MSISQDRDLKVNFPSFPSFSLFIFFSFWLVGLGWLFSSQEHVNKLGNVQCITQEQERCWLFLVLATLDQRVEDLLPTPKTGQLHSSQAQILSGDPICPLFLQFLFFFPPYSLINTGNELHMAMAFTSLCEICSSCIVYQFNMFTTDAISVSQLSCFKSPFPTRYVPPQSSQSSFQYASLQPDSFSKLMPHSSWKIKSARGGLNFAWPSQLMESSEIFLCFRSHQTQGKLTSKGANDGRADPEPFAWD